MGRGRGRGRVWGGVWNMWCFLLFGFWRCFVLLVFGVVFSLDWVQDACFFWSVICCSSFFLSL